MAVDLATARDAYYDNADYLAENDLTKAKAFLTACIQLKGLSPKKSDKGSSMLELHDVDWDAAIAMAREFVEANSDDHQVKHSLLGLGNWQS